MSDRRKGFSSSLCVQTALGAHPASFTMGTANLFPGGGGKARPGARRRPLTLSSAKVVNEYELHILSPQAPTWRVAGLLYFITYVVENVVILDMNQ
jgi:hypothetical protein